MVDYDLSLGPYDEVRKYLLDAEGSGTIVPISALDWWSVNKLDDLEVPFELDAGKYPPGLTPNTMLGRNGATLFPCTGGSVTPPATPVPTGSSFGNPTEMCTAIANQRSAMLAWEQAVPGLRFVPYNSAVHDGFARLTDGGAADCQVSTPSTAFPNRRLVKIRGCVSNVGIITHEFGHVLGLKHEHKRPDRDSYVTNYRTSSGQYSALGTGFGDSDMPYDFGSVMGYPSYRPGDTTTRTTTPDRVTMNSFGVITVEVQSAWGGAFDQAVVVCGPQYHRSLGPPSAPLPTCTLASEFGVGDTYTFIYKGTVVLATSGGTLTLTGPPNATTPGGVPAWSFAAASSTLFAGEPASDIQDESNWLVSYSGIDYADPSLTFAGEDVTASPLAGFGRNTTGPSPIDASSILRWHEQFNPDAAPAQAGEKYGHLIAHGDLDGDGIVDMVVSAPGEGTPGALIVYKGHIRTIEGTTGFARARVIDDFGATSMAVADIDGDGFEDLVVGGVRTSTGWRGVRVYSGNLGLTLPELLTITQQDPDLNGLNGDWTDASGNPYLVDSDWEFGASIAVLPNTVMEGVQGTLLVVGAPKADSYYPYDSTATGPCPDGDSNGRIDCEEDTGVAFVYDLTRLKLLAVLDPYSGGVIGNKSGEEFGFSVEAGYLEEETPCASIVVGAPGGYEAVFDSLTSTFVASQQVPGTLAGPPTSVVGQVYLATPGPSDTDCFDFDTIVRTATTNEQDSDFGWALHVGNVRTPKGTPGSGFTRDLLVGAPGSTAFEGDLPIGNSGAVYVYEGSPEMFSGDPDVADVYDARLDVPLFEDSFGGSCGAGVGDRFGEAIVTGTFDGWTGELPAVSSTLDEIAIGAPGRPVCAAPQSTGAAYVFTGETGGTWPHAGTSEHRMLLVDTCTNRGPTASRFGRSLSAQPLNTFAAAPTASQYPYPSGIVTYPWGETDLWIGAPFGDSDGSGATGGMVQSIHDKVRYEGVDSECYP